jgi:hypothetical protein
MRQRIITAGLNVKSLSRVTGILEGILDPLDSQQFYRGRINALFIASFSMSPFDSAAFSLA